MMFSRCICYRKYYYIYHCGVLVHPLLTYLNNGECILKQAEMVQEAGTLHGPEQPEEASSGPLFHFHEKMFSTEHVAIAPEIIR